MIYQYINYVPFQLSSRELKDATDLDAGEDSWKSLGQQEDQTSFS